MKVAEIKSKLEEIQNIVNKKLDQVRVFDFTAHLVEKTPSSINKKIELLEEMDLLGELPLITIINKETGENMDVHLLYIHNQKMYWYDSADFFYGLNMTGVLASIEDEIIIIEAVESLTTPLISELEIEDGEFVDVYWNNNIFFLKKDGNQFRYQLTKPFEEIKKQHRDEILSYCLATITMEDEVTLRDVFLHGKYIAKV